MNMSNSVSTTDQNIEECMMYLSGEGNYIFGEEVSIDQYDFAIVKSLGKQLGSGNAFTEKQSHIGLRIVKKYNRRIVVGDIQPIVFGNRQIFSHG